MILNVKYHRLNIFNIKHKSSAQHTQSLKNIIDDLILVQHIYLIIFNQINQTYLSLIQIIFKKFPAHEFHANIKQDRGLYYHFQYSSDQTRKQIL